MRRREFIALTVGAAALPFAARAQQAGKVWRVGMLDTTSASLNVKNIDAFRAGMRALGYVEGQNLIIDYRSFDGRIERLPQLATELVKLKCDVLVTRGTPPALAAKRAAGGLPIVMAAIGEPIESGMVESLAPYQRPELAAEAAAEVRRQAGNEPILLRVSFNSTMIGFTTTFKDDSYPIASMRGNAVYNWSLNGLQRGAGSLASSSSNPDAPFGVDEVDWDLLPKIVADARTKLEMPNGRVTSINVNKPTDSVGTPVPVWSVYIEQSGERGEYYADVNGVTKTVSLPPSRRKPANWLEPTAIADALGRIVQGFSPDAKFEEICFYDSYVRITAQDPRKPGELMQVNLRERGLYRWGSVMFPKRREDDFPLQDLRLAKENIAAMLDRTLTELNMPGGRFTDVIIGRHNAEKSRGKGATVQIRAEAHGVGAGYVVFEADGSVERAVRLGRP